MKKEIKKEKEKEEKRSLKNMIAYFETSFEHV